MNPKVVFEIPQVVQTFRERDASGLSATMLVLMAIGSVLQLYYNVCIGANITILNNVCSILTSFILLWAKYKFSETETPENFQFNGSTKTAVLRDAVDV